ICFFQAEDGIRDFHVTGVQTSALPICLCTGGHDRCQVSTPAGVARYRGNRDAAGGKLRRLFPAVPPLLRDSESKSATRGSVLSRSEERRVGKEGRCSGELNHVNVRLPD